VILSDILEHTTRLSLIENWDRAFTIINDHPLSAAYWKLEEMSGEQFLDELPELQLCADNIYNALN
jgi:hypothetical protein